MWHFWAESEKLASCTNVNQGYHLRANYFSDPCLLHKRFFRSMSSRSTVIDSAARQECALTPFNKVCIFLSNLNLKSDFLEHFYRESSSGFHSTHRIFQLWSPCITTCQFSSDPCFFLKKIKYAVNHTLEVQFSHFRENPSHITFPLQTQLTL